MRRGISVALVALLAGFPALAGEAAAALELRAAPEVSDTGYYRLSWDDDAGDVELQEAADARFSEPRTCTAARTPRP